MVIFVEFISDGLQVPHAKIDVEFLRMNNYRLLKAQDGYVSDNDDPLRPKVNFILPGEKDLVTVEYM